MEDVRRLCGNLGGYEADFLYICAFLSAFESPLKSPAWTFVGLRAALESPRYDPVLKNIMRRCFVLASRNIIGGVDDENDSRMDRAIARLITDRPLEASILFQGRTFAEIESVGFLSLNYEDRARMVRFIMQATFETPHMILQNAEPSGTSLVGVDAEGSRYHLLKDTSLEVGCWKEVDKFGSVELIATTTDALLGVSNGLRSPVVFPDRTKNTCVYCRKKLIPTATDTYLCSGCSVGACHIKCLTSVENDGFRWSCCPDCKQLTLANHLRDFANEIEPQQKAAARKKRRLASELSSLQISAKDYGSVDTRRRESTTSRGGRLAGKVDYSFRDYDKAISNAIRKSERKSSTEFYSSEEDISYRQPSRNMSRDERMALRNQKYAPMSDVSQSNHVGTDISGFEIDQTQNEPFIDTEPRLTADNDILEPSTPPTYDQSRGIEPVDMVTERLVDDKVQDMMDDVELDRSLHSSIPKTNLDITSPSLTTHL